MNNYSVSVSMVFPIEGSEVYNERFVMSGKDENDIRRRVRTMLGDPRYMVAIRKV